MESSSKFCRRIARNKLKSKYYPRIMNEMKKVSVNARPADLAKSSMIEDQASPVSSTNTERNAFWKLLKLFIG